MISDPSSPNLLRYTQPTHRRWLIDDGIGMWVHPDGEWVMYRDHVARLAQLAQEQATLRDLLKEIEQHCPCGARPESPATHPHVGGCPVARALMLVNGEDTKC